MEVYEDRLYQCYGQFKDKSLVYTLTKRMDLQKQECFVGIPSHDGKHKIMEAGEHCDRGLQPHLYGMNMELIRELKCHNDIGDETKSLQNEVIGRDETEIKIKLLNSQQNFKSMIESKVNDEVKEFRNKYKRMKLSDIPIALNTSSHPSYLLNIYMLFLVAILSILF